MGPLNHAWPCFEFHSSFYSFCWVPAGNPRPEKTHFAICAFSATCRAYLYVCWSPSSGTIGAHGVSTSWFPYASITTTFSHFFYYVCLTRKNPAGQISPSLFVWFWLCSYSVIFFRFVGSVSINPSHRCVMNLVGLISEANMTLERRPNFGFLISKFAKNYFWYLSEDFGLSCL